MAVVLKVGAEMRCEECPAKAPAELILLGTGTLAFRPADPKDMGKWEVALPGGAITAPYATRCPEHKRSGLVTASAAMGQALAKAH